MPYQTTDPTDPRVTVFHLGNPPALAPWLHDLGLGNMEPLPAPPESALDFEGQAGAYAAAWARSAAWEAERDRLNAGRQPGDPAAVEVRRKHLAAGLEVLTALRAAAEAVRPMVADAHTGLAATVANTKPCELTPATVRRLTAADAAYTQVANLSESRIPRAERWLREALVSLPPGPPAEPAGRATVTPPMVEGTR